MKRSMENFGIKIFVKTPGFADGRLDTSCFRTGIFLGYSLNDRNIIYRDYLIRETKKIRHFTIDKAHFSTF